MQSPTAGNQYRMNLKARAHQVLGHLGLEVRRPLAPLVGRPQAQLTINLDHLIALRMQTDPDIFFVQIGAFDGQTGDQLHKYVVEHRWQGILVEPQPEQFTALRTAYRDHPQLDLRNIAISDKAETRTLYAIDTSFSGLPDWAPQIATFDRARIEAAEIRGPDGEMAICEYEVPCLPLSDLLADVVRVDLLQVDTEGFDAEIIRMFDFHTFRPSIVRFENVCLSRADHEMAVARLVQHGYRVAITGNDTLAWLE
jgi:FkbM family methyltransferase